MLLYNNYIVLDEHSININERVVQLQVCRFCLHMNVSAEAKACSEVECLLA